MPKSPIRIRNYIDIDDEKTTIGVFIDLKKAFDTIDHKVLELDFFGIGAWFKNWLNRTCQIESSMFT